MFARKPYIFAVGVVLLIFAFNVPVYDARSLGVSAAAGTAGILAMIYCSFFQRPDYFPRIERDTFRDQQNYEEWRKYAQANDEYSRVVWWAFQLPPDQFIHFVQLVVELRYTADQQGLAKLRNIFRRK